MIYFIETISQVRSMRDMSTDNQPKSNDLHEFVNSMLELLYNA